MSSVSDETPRSPEDPDSDWVNHRQTVGVAIVYFILICTVLVSMACAVTTSSTILDGLSNFFVSMALAPIGLFGVILFSLMIEINISSLRLRYLRLLQLINILFFASASLVPIYGAGFGFVGEVASYGTRWASPNTLKNIFISALTSGSFMITGFGVYFICALVHRVRASSTR